MKLQKYSHVKNTTDDFGVGCFLGIFTNLSQIQNKTVTFFQYDFSKTYD